MLRSSLRRLFTTSLVTLFALAASTALTSRATAAVPDPTQSSVPSCFLGCPFGDIDYTVIVRDVIGAPFANAVVELDLCTCTTLAFCPIVKGGSVCNRTVLSAADGSATFNIHVGGICPSGFGVVRADGVVLAGGIQVRTVDLDGNQMVDNADHAIAMNELGQPGGIADFDCSGTVNGQDLGIQNGHLGHNCEEAVPASPASWGQVKTIYR